MTPDPAPLRRLVLGLCGVGLALGLWQLVGVEGWAGPTWPTLTAVVRSLTLPYRRHLYLRACGATLSMAALGYALGFALGLGAAILGHVLPLLRPGLDRLASLLHAIPLIALAPLFIVLLSRSRTGMAMAAIGVFFVAYVSACAALEASSTAHRHLFRAFGATTPTRLLLLDLPASLPALSTGLRQAVPVAFLGTILGEWFGAAHGLGLLMVSAMQNFQIALLWSAVVLCCGLSLALFGLMGAIERLVARRFR